MHLTRPSLVALIVASLIVGWLLPLPDLTAQEQSLPDDFTFASGEWVEQIETRVDRNAALLQAMLLSMDATEDEGFREALRRMADEDALPEGIREQTQQVLNRLEQQ